MEAVKPATSFFNFLSTLGYPENQVRRMNWRHQHIVGPIERDLVDARVLDLGSHDGRWLAAFAGSGAREVIGIEGRQHLVDKFAAFPKEFRRVVSLRTGDFVESMDELIKDGETFDVIGCLGVYYHTMHHYRMLCQMATLRPKLIIIDSEFIIDNAPVIRMTKEQPNKDLNTIEQFHGQDFAPIGIPSLQAVRVMAESVGYCLEEVEWIVPEGSRGPVNDYFNERAGRRRGTVALRAGTQAVALRP